MKKIVFILFISFLISQICLGNSNVGEQQDKLGVSIIGSRFQRGTRMNPVTATMVSPNNLPLVCTDTYVYGTVPITQTISSLDEVYIYSDGWTGSWIASSWGVTSPHSFSATFNTSPYTIPTGPTTLHATVPSSPWEFVADFMVSDTGPFVSSLMPPSANRGTTVTTYVYPVGMDPTSTLVSDEDPFGLLKDGDFITATSWNTESPGVCYQVTTTLPETVAPGDWLFYMMFNQDNFRYNINKTFGVTDPTVTWTGSVMTDTGWGNANNWDPSGVPDSGSDVIIPSGVPNNPSLDINGWCNNLEVNSGGQLNIPDYTLNVGNNFTNSGTIYQTGGTVEFYGTITNTGTYTAGGGTVLYGSTAITQTIAPSIDYHNLKATGENKVLSGNTSVYGYTNLDGAGIDIDNYDFTSYSHQISQTTSNQDYIITSGTGSLKYGSVSTPSVSSGLFPIGPDANNYNHFYFNNAGVNLDWLSARVQPGITPSHPNSPYCLPLTWDINYGPLGSLSANFEFGWNGVQETALFTNARENGRIQAHVNHTGSLWETIGSPGSACGPGPEGGYTFQDGPFDLVSGFALGDEEHTLPVELSSFTAQFISNLPILCWTTQSESGNAGWNVYRGDYRDAFINGDAIQINPELIEGAGTTSIPTNYTFEDQYDVIQGTEYWYILESVDYSGETQIHGSVSLIIPEEGTTPELPQITILKGNYPNPFNPFTTIIFDVKENETAQLSIFNAKGQKIESISFEAGTYNYLWDASSYASGIYLYKLKSESISVTKKMVLLK